MRGSGLPLGLKFLISDALPDHAHLTGLPRINFISKKRRTHGLSQTHLPRQKIGAARVGYKTNTGEGLHKISRFSCNHHVRCERQIRPSPRGWTIDGRNGRHRTFCNGFEHWHIFIFQRALEIDIRKISLRAQILPRTKRPA